MKINIKNYKYCLPFFKIYIFGLNISGLLPASVFNIIFSFHYFLLRYNFVICRTMATQDVHIINPRTC